MPKLKRKRKIFPVRPNNEIGYKTKKMRAVLLNTYPRSFIFDGVRCSSMESFLQSLKFKNEKKQTEICSLTAKEARREGEKKIFWKWTGNAYWRGKKYKFIKVVRVGGKKKFCRGDDYRELLRRAYQAMYEQNDSFREALKRSDHIRAGFRREGISPRKLLTRREFVEILETLLENNNWLNERGKNENI